MVLTQIAYKFESALPSEYEPNDHSSKFPLQGDPKKPGLNALIKAIQFFFVCNTWIMTNSERTDLL